MGNHILHRLPRASKAINIPDDLVLGHADLRERTPDVDPGNRLSSRNRQCYEIIKRENNGAHGTRISFALGQLALLETASAKPAFVLGCRRGPIYRNTNNIKAGISRQANGPSLNPELCLVLRSHQDAIDSLVEIEAGYAFDRFAILRRETQFEFGFDILPPALPQKGNTDSRRDNP